MEDFWKDVAGYEGCYQVSPLGDVRSLSRRIPRGTGFMALKGRVLVPAKAGRGYPFVVLYVGGTKKSAYVHRLVAEAFIGPCPPNREVNHKDGNKDNNSVGNLEYVSRAENLRHARESGLLRLVGADNPRCKYSEAQIRKAYGLVASGKRHREAAEATGVDQGTVESVVRGKNWRHLGLLVGDSP